MKYVAEENSYQPDPSRDGLIQTAFSFAVIAKIGPETIGLRFAQIPLEIFDPFHH